MALTIDSILNEKEVKKEAKGLSVKIRKIVSR